MKNIWYADDKDLVKWSTLFYLLEDFQAERILQIAFYREEKFGLINIDSNSKEIPQEVVLHFRNIRNACQMNLKVPIEVFVLNFNDRERQEYVQKVIDLISKYPKERLVVFLDPDTGLQPEKKDYRPQQEHVLNTEAKKIYEALKPGDIFVFYQHQTNRKGKEWINPKKHQLAEAIGLPAGAFKCAYGPEITKDVVLFYTQRG